MTLSYKQQLKKNQYIKKLNRVKKFEIINRLLCYACVFPFFHTAACLGQQKEVPVVDTVGSIGLVLSAASAVKLQNKEEELTEKISRIKALERG
ncbi:MAG: hypothetical protein ACI4OR_04580 [Alphaproteobacteria bacterium]